MTCILCYLKGDLDHGLLFCFLSITSFSDANCAGNSFGNQSTNAVAHSSAKAMYRSMDHNAFKTLCVLSLHQDNVVVPTPMYIYCDNQASIFITNNLVLLSTPNISRLSVTLFKIY